MAIINCPECGKEISDQAAACPSCGTPINGGQNNADSKKFCKFCGEQIDKECVICPKCGKQVEELHQTDNKNIIINNNNTSSSSSNAVVNGGGGMMISPKSRLVTLLLCLFLGGLAIHRFYVGKVGTGILMILLMCTGIGEVWLLVDFIMILLGSFTDNFGNKVMNW